MLAVAISNSLKYKFTASLRGVNKKTMTHRLSALGTWDLAMILLCF